MSSLLDLVRNAKQLPVFPIGGPCRCGCGQSRWDDADWLLHHAESWGASFTLTGVDDTTLCAAMAGPVPAGVYAREYYREHPITTVAQVARLRTPSPAESEFLAPSLATIRAVAGRGTPVLASVWGPLTVAATLAGVDGFLRRSLEDVGFVASLLESATNTVLQYSAAALDAGADFLWVAEPLAALMSPTLFAQYGAGPLSALVGVAGARHKDTIIHVCGDTSHLTELLDATGAAGLSLDANVDLVDTAERCRPVTVVMGNLWPMDLIEKTPASIAQATAAMVERMTGRPYVAATGCSCPQNTPPASLAAFVDTAIGAPGLAARHTTKGSA